MVDFTEENLPAILREISARNDLVLRKPPRMLVSIRISIVDGGAAVDKC